MIFKPSEVTPLTALKLAEIYSEGACRTACLTSCQGVWRETGQYLTEHPVSPKSPSPAASPAAKK